MRHFPPYPKKPHRTGQARIRPNGRDVYLGVFGSPESHQEYARLKAEWEAGQVSGETVPGTGSIGTSGGRLSVAEAVLLFFERCRSHQLREPDGSPKKELSFFRDALAPLTALYGRTNAADFRVKALVTVREEYVKRGLTPRTINKHTIRVRHVFRWLEEQELVPPGTWHHLRTLRGLRVGNVDVLPVPEDDLAAGLSKMNRVVRAIADLLLLTGGRPSEIMGLRPQDIVREGRVEVERGQWLELSGGVWAAPLKKHKTAYAGRRRTLLFGPRAQQILAPFLHRNADHFLFSPREAVLSKQVLRQRRRIGTRYQACALAHAFRAACRKAGVPTFTPYQLRHNAATRLAAEFGPDVARIVLGHRDLAVTRVYVADDLRRAIEAMERAG